MWQFYFDEAKILVVNKRTYILLVWSDAKMPVVVVPPRPSHMLMVTWMKSS